MVEFGLITTLVFWWVVGLAGCRLADKWDMPRLFSATLLAWIVVTVGHAVGLSPSVPGDLYVSRSRIEAYNALEELRDKNKVDVETLKSIGVTEIAITEFKVTAERKVKIQEQRLYDRTAADRRTVTLAIVFPVVVVTIIVVLISAPWTSPVFMRRLPFMGVAFASAALGGVLVALVLHGSGWVTPQEPAWHWVVALAVSVAVVSCPLKCDFDDTLWRSGFEPLLYALAGASVSLFTDFDWLLVLLVLIAFVDCKSAGPVLLSRFVVKRDWLTAIGDSLPLLGGSAAALAVALCFHACGWLDGPAFTALVIANVAAAGLIGPMQRWWEREVSSSKFQVPS